MPRTSYRFQYGMPIDFIILNNIMKKNILLAAAAAAAGIAYYIVRKRKTSKQSGYVAQGNKPAHHVTDVFARAKEQAVK